MKRDSEVTKLNNVAERINESTANPVIDSVLAMASEYICGLSNGSRLVI